ncbi:MAG: radical SAM protein [Deltaproteobacteria bacterium]|nr:radical SAM protein [Deltaproteobacteria bacterium]
MKILLIYPYFIENRMDADDVRVVPQGLYSVAAVLMENHYDAEILNWHDMGESRAGIETILRDKRPDVIGFSILHGNRWGGIDIARIAKGLDPGVRIVFGGVGATFLWDHLLRHFPEIDFVVPGEGEYPFLHLVEWFKNQRGQDLENIDGIAYRDNNRPVQNAAAPLMQNLNALPIPAKYFTYHHVSSSRGCAWKCRFCGSPRFWGGRLRLRSPAHFVDELEILYRRGITFFYFSDDTFTAGKQRVIDICRMILERNIKITWNAISRVNMVDEDILYWMRRAGCIQISYGVESGSEKIRSALQKDIQTDHIKEAFSLTTRYGILSRAYFIYGAPGETRETIQETIDLIRDIKPLSVIFYILDIFPGTDLYEGLKRTAGITDDIWLNRIEGIMYFETDHRYSDALILEYGKKLREAFYGQVHHFAEEIPLIDRKDLYNSHADFLSRLGMTFSHGEYSKNEWIQEKAETAEKLYTRSLHYGPDHRAYLGLGAVKQKKGLYRDSIRILEEGIGYFPDSPELNLCISINYMNLMDYKKALTYLGHVSHSAQAHYYRAQCYRALGDRENEERHMQKYRALS